jgi:hypothetical protein
MSKRLTSGQIRRELAILINTKQESLTTDKDKKYAVEVARQEINVKYGKNWRERFDNSFHSYDEWWSEKNLDGSFAYNGITDEF